MSDGEIRYLQIPAANLEVSAGFYESVFGWEIRTQTNGQRAFDDASGHVSGTWVLDRTPAREPGVLVWVMVNSVEVKESRWRGRLTDDATAGHSVPPDAPAPNRSLTMAPHEAWSVGDLRSRLTE